MVLVQLVEPATQLLLFTDALSNTQTLQEWRQQREIPTDTNISNDATDATDATIHELEDLEADTASLKLARSMVELAEESGGKQWWMFSSLVTTTEDSTSKIAKLMEADHLLLHYQLPVPRVLTDVEQLSQFLNLFSIDTLTVLSSAGHARVAHDVKTLVEAVRTTTTPQPQQHSTTTNTITGSWGSGDDCHLWYATGNYNLESTGRQVNLPLEEEEGLLQAGPHKHALEFTRNNPLSSSSDNANAINMITVHNPFTTDRMLSLTYLTDADSMSYPKTRVVVNGVSTVLLHPFHDGAETRHVARTSGVGYVHPGTSTVRLDPLQSTALPFRLLGASLLAEEVQDLQSIEFALETESLAAESDDQVLDPSTTAIGYLSSVFR